ncbi:MAG: ComEC family competence protein [Saprospiraceae bacterium]|nr:ComEC family competence protein [Saprospiraceae bacterium]
MSFWKQWPATRVLIPYLLGILSCEIVAVNVLPWPGIPLCLLLLFFLLWYWGWQPKKRVGQSLFGICISLWLWMVGFYHAKSALDERVFWPANVQERNPVSVIGDIQHCQTPKGKTTRCTSLVQMVITESDTFHGVGNKVIVFTPDVLAFTPGTKVRFQGKLQAVSGPRNISEFNYKRFLALQGIHWQMFASKWIVYPTAKDRSFHTAVASLQEQVRHRLTNGMNYTSGLSIAMAVVLGDRSQLDESIEEAYTHSGAMHVLAVSGLHVGLLAWMIHFCLSQLLPYWEWKTTISIVISILFIWAYALITGLGPSVFRSAVMYSFVLLGKKFPGRVNIWNSLAAAAFILLCFEPLWIYQLGFQLSFLAVIGIVFWYPILFKVWFPSHWLLRYGWRLTCVGIAAQLSTFPLTIHHLGQFPYLFWISGWIALPLTTCILGGGILKIVMDGIPGLSNGLAWVLDKVIYAQNISLETLASLRWSIEKGIVLGPVACILLLLACSTIMLCYASCRGVEWTGWVAIGMILIVTFEQQKKHQQELDIVFITRNGVFVEMVQGERAIQLFPHNNRSSNSAYLSSGFHQEYGITDVEEYALPPFRYSVYQMNHSYGVWWQSGAIPDSVLSQVSVLIVDGDHPPPASAWDTMPFFKELVFSPRLSFRNRMLWEHVLVTSKNNRDE